MPDFLRHWRRVPLIIRAVITGVLVFQILQNGWYGAFFVNMSVLPIVPWSVPLGLLWLWLLFQYFGGRWRPESTREVRKQGLRARKLSGEQWKWSLVAGALYIIFLMAFVNVVYRIIELPEEEFDLSMFPWWSLFPILIMVSIVAGVSEEAGFRGYMQGPLERRYGPVFAIGFTAFMFWVVHLNHADAVPRFPVLMVMGAALGALAYCAQSIWPAIVAHAAVDTVAFLNEVGKVGPQLVRQTPLAETGVDLYFVVSLLLAAVVCLASVWTLRKLYVVTRRAG
jgi:membrane protease YdiL (CAAX protease family)